MKLAESKSSLYRPYYIMLNTYRSNNISCGEVWGVKGVGGVKEE